MKYILYDTDPSQDPVYGVYDTFEEAEAARGRYITSEVERMLKEDYKDLGLDPTNPDDIQWLRFDTELTLAIQKLEKNY